MTEQTIDPNGTIVYSSRPECDLSKYTETPNINPVGKLYWDEGEIYVTATKAYPFISRVGLATTCHLASPYTTPLGLSMWLAGFSKNKPIVMAAALIPVCSGTFAGLYLLKKAGTVKDIEYKFGQPVKITNSEFMYPKD